MNYAIPMTIDFPTQSREDFADRFSDLSSFLYYVREEQEVTKDEWRYSLYMLGDKVVIEEQPIGDLAVLFDSTIHKYSIDESWRYVAMDWFDTVCGIFVDM